MNNVTGLITDLCMMGVHCLYIQGEIAFVFDCQLCIMISKLFFITNLSLPASRRMM